MICCSLILIEVNLEASRFEELSRELAKCQEHLAAHHIVAALQKLLCVGTISEVLPALKDSPRGVYDHYYHFII